MVVHTKKAKEEVPDFVKKNFWEFRPNKKGLHAFFASIIPSFFIFLIFLYLFLDVNNPTKSGYGFPFLASMLFFGIWYYNKSESNKEIWSKMLSSSAVLSFILPVAMFIGGVKMTAQQTNPFAMVGSAIGTGIATVFFGFLFLLIGLAFAVGAYFVNKSLKK